MRWLDSISDLMDINLSKLRRQWRTEEPDMLQSMGLQRVNHDLAIEQQQHYCRPLLDLSNLLQLKTMLHSEECLGSHTKWNRPGLIHIQLQPCLSVQVPSLDRMVRHLGPQFPIQNWDNNTYITRFCVIFCLEDMAPIKLLLFITFDQVYMDTE